MDGRIIEGRCTERPRLGDVAVLQTAATVNGVLAQLEIDAIVQGMATNRIHFRLMRILFVLYTSSGTRLGSG